MKTLAQTSAVLVILLTSLAPGHATFAAASKSDVAHLFKADCSRCHGMDGKGLAAIHTPDFTNPKWQAMRFARIGIPLSHVMAPFVGLVEITCGDASFRHLGPASSAPAKYPQVV